MIIFIPLGIVASIFQLALLREFSFSIAKNELTFVVAAGFWIAFCSLGSISKIPKKLSKLTLCILSSLAFSVFICLIHLIKSLIGLKYYEATSLGLVLFLSIILIGPTAFIIGIIFKNFVQEFLKNNQVQKNTFALFFAFEAIGFFLGGIAFTFCFINYINPLIFTLLPILLIPGIKNRYQKILAALIILFVSIISILSFNAILKKEFANADIIVNLGSAYGPVIGTYKSGATTIFSQGSVLATSEDKSANEEFIHMSLSATDPSAIKDILFIGAAVSGQIEEIAKYKLNSLDCLQINPLISQIAKNNFPAGLKNQINFITADPRIYLKNLNKRYDAILMNMPAPTNLALNRYFTQEFFKLILGHLKPKGIFSFTIPSKREILSPQFNKFNSSIINAVDKVFLSKLIVPSDAMLIIASKEEIKDYVLLDNFGKANLKTDYFTIYHFKDYLSPSIRSYTQNMLDKLIQPNTDLVPSGFLNYLILEQIKFYPDLKIDFQKIRIAVITFLLFFAVFIIIASYLFKRISCLSNIASIGFTSISFSSIIFVLFQLYCGALFWKLGLLIALFMAGSSIGIFFMNAIKFKRTNLLSWLYLCWVTIIFILFFYLKVIDNCDYAELVFYFLALICGFLTGSSYPLLVQNLLKNKFDDKNIPVVIYSTDLIGAFAGTLASGILLIPFLGIPNSFLTLIFLNLIFALKNLRN